MCIETTFGGTKLHLNHVFKVVLWPSTCPSQTSRCKPLTHCWTCKMGPQQTRQSKHRNILWMQMGLPKCTSKPDVEAPSFIYTMRFQVSLPAPIKSQGASLWPSKKNADPSTNPHSLAKIRRFHQNHAYFNKIQYPGGWVSGFGKCSIEPPFGDTELYNPLTDLWNYTSNKY